MVDEDVDGGVVEGCRGAVDVVEGGRSTVGVG